MWPKSDYAFNQMSGVVAEKHILEYVSNSDSRLSLRRWSEGNLLNSNQFPRIMEFGALLYNVLMFLFVLASLSS